MPKKYDDGWTEFSATTGFRREVSHMFEGDDAIMAAKVQDQMVLRQTPKGRLRATATIYETEGRPFHSLTVQRWNGANKPEEYFALSAAECRKFLEFIDRIKRTTLDRAANFWVQDDENKTVLVAADIDFEKLEAVTKYDPAKAEALARFVEEEYSLRDLQAVAYRRKELAHFKRLLDDESFREEQRLLFGGPEKLWQAFFEKNPWIFGYGLSYMPLSKLSRRSLEVYLQGRGIGGVGKEADAVMKSNALISGLAVVEIKSPFGVDLLDSKSLREGVYHPSGELSAAVAQVQVSVQIAVEAFGHSLRIEGPGGDKTGEELHFVQPRAYLVVGHLDQLMGEHGVNDQKYRSFEIYRRSLRSPEIFTFDELYERARHIVEYEPPKDEA
ncbi:DUF4263 domain-containing protein [Devosia sp. LjRoot16]|uniref:Shedu immune nuclease family protein n=1 Tax=Devosia sp. LjRoot16 TaxID=3342271 RepID=UPI003ED0E1BB